MRALIWISFASAALLALSACGDDSSGSGGTAGGGASGGGDAGGGGGGVGGGSLVQTVRVAGTVVDFESGAAITGSATVSTEGLTPPPTVSVTGAEFEISNVAPFSAFHLLSGSPPDYRSTYNVVTEVQDMDVSGVQAPVVAEAYLTALSAAFNETGAAGTGVMIARFVDEAGAPKAGVPASAFTINGGAPPATPRFLDGAKAAAPALNQTSDSGYVVFYDLPPGLVTLGAAQNSGLTIVGAVAPVAATAVTLAEAKVTTGGPVLPTNVSFSNDVIPVFSQRGCTGCHAGGGVGVDLGNLSLNASANNIYKELTEEISINYNKTRVDLANPAQSLILTMPSFEAEPDPHPNATFTSTSDPSYLILLAWITEGAKQN